MTNEDARVARRLATRFSSTSWIGICIRLDAAPGEAVHYFTAAWTPPERGPSRWPEAVVIGSPTSARALWELMRHLPNEAMLHLASLDDVDAALAADILLAGDRNLPTSVRESVAAFAQSERQRTQAIVAQRYTDRDPAFERFRAKITR
ncbi:MAG TPA: hypothetical protein VNE58_16350 [Casimicrobiaceae bacterium]|nr:hypothetical protein [Casimicrobiaceae bacterium]